MESVLMSWSGGKDSCLALRELQRDPGLRVEALLTTVSRDYDRISMHGVRNELLQRQAEALGLPLHLVSISKGASNADYEAEWGRALDHHRGLGVGQVAFGDLFLEDIRAYREKLLAAHGMEGMYPLWGRDTRQLASEFIALGFRSVLVCVDPAKLDPRFAGRIFDEDLLSELPEGVDPCGENGEFHSFVFDGPSFTRPVRFSIGEKVCRESFWFCDLLPQA